MLTRAGALLNALLGFGFLSAAVATGASSVIDSRHLDYPDLGDASPKVVVVFDAPSGMASNAAIYVLDEADWLLVHQGQYTRGSLLSGRGGAGNRYRLIDRNEDFSDLQFVNGELIIVRPNLQFVLFAL